jgi:hypothetical protein
MEIMISKERMEQSLRYLAETDEQFADLKTAVERTKMKAKAIWGAIASRASGTVLERESTADNHDSYDTAMAAHFTALKEFEHIKNKRVTETIVIDVWRSLNAARNKGQIV